SSSRADRYVARIRVSVSATASVRPFASRAFRSRSPMPSRSSGDDGPRSSCLVCLFHRANDQSFEAATATAPANAALPRPRPGFGEAAVPRIEVGRPVGSIHHDGHTRGVQILQGLADIADRFGAGADDGDGILGERAQVRGYIPRLLGPQVDTADAAGGDDGN